MNKVVTIVLLNYNGFKDTIACLESLKKLVYKNFNILIVDNASTDDSVNKIEEYIKSYCSDYICFNLFDKAMDSNDHQRKITIIQTGFNGGYGYGNNKGIEYALKKGADYILILNNDTVVDQKFLEPMVVMCENDKNIGIVSGQIFYYDRPDVFWFNGGTYNNCTGRIKHINYNQTNNGQIPPENITFITGCLWLIPKHVFITVGYINEEYFMYLEDLEFSQRVIKSGLKLQVSNESHIFHKVGSSSGGELTTFSLYWRTRNWILFMQKNMQYMCWFFGFFNGILRFSFISILSLRFDLLKSQYEGIVSLIKKQPNRVKNEKNSNN